MKTYTVTITFTLDDAAGEHDHDILRDRIYIALGNPSDPIMRVGEPELVSE